MECKKLLSGKIEKYLPLDVFSENVENIVETLAENSPIGLTENGAVAAVVIGYADYYAMNETLAMLRLLAMSQEDVAKSRIVPAEETFAQTRLMINETHGKK
ncbi:hypothetical protein LJC48_03705 [Desulfovibrio sp. OttesenSCG-928-C06]|nr:hypothetical protein [Desulfovibrio sp. OttesenSCG-928-C06]